MQDIPDRTCDSLSNRFRKTIKPNLVKYKRLLKPDEWDLVCACFIEDVPESSTPNKFHEKVNRYFEVLDRNLADAILLISIL